MNPAMVSQALEVLIHIVFWATIVSIVLPPVEVFNKFPRFQMYYAVVVAVVSYIALNVRGKIAKAYNNGNGGVDPVQQRLDDISKGDSK